MNKFTKKKKENSSEGNFSLPKNKLKYTLSLVITIVGLLSLFGGTSYAILKGSTQSSNNQVIKTGSIKLKLTENFESINKKIVIMEDSEGLLQTEAYEFNIKNIGSDPAKYDIKLVNEKPSDYTGNLLDDKYIKVGLEINEEEYGPFTLKEVNNIIDSDIIYKNEIISYTLRIWLDKDSEEEISNLEDSKAFLKLKVDAEQRVEDMDSGINTKVFNYTGDVQKYAVQRNGYYYIEMAGAEGGKSNNVTTLGAKTSGYVYLEAGEKLYFYVGKQGTDANTNCRTSGYEFNGGGIAKPAKTGVCGATGGGATDVRLVGGNWDDTSSLISRIMVAGAGGGSTHVNDVYTHGFGGTLYGAKPTHATYQSYLGLPGTQIAGGDEPTKYSTAQSNGTAGSFGKGGFGGASSTTATTGGGAGGGAGYYGGSGASGLNSGVWPGGGGSSYISGYAGVDSVKESTTITHTNQTLHYSGKYFVGGQMTEGTNSGNGYAKISYVDTKPKRRNTKLNNVRYIKNCVNYNSSNNSNHWIELQAIKDGVNIAKGKTVTGTTAENTARPYSRIVDGDITYANYSGPSSAANNQCVTVDLGQNYDLDEVALWNYFGDQRRYISNNFQVSSDNTNWQNLSVNEAWYETSNGARYNAYIDHINGYSRSGLQIWYDGYANTGKIRNATSTTWKNLASSSYTGTLVGGKWYSNYLYLDGTDDWVKIAQYNPAKLTMEVVYKKDSNTGGTEEVLLGNVNAGGYAITYLNNSFIAEYYIASGYRQVQDASFTLGKIRTNSSSYDQSTIKLYTNGKTHSTLSYPGTIGTPTNSTILAIGANPSGTSAGSNSFFLGKVYSVRVYNRALTDDEVLHNYLYDKQKFNIE